VCEDRAIVWSKRRRPSAPPVLLPSLDRLAALIERVVELVDAVGGAEARAETAEAPEPARTPAEVVATAPADAVWLAFVPSPHGYGLVERSGAAPDPGDVLELDGGRYRVVRLAPSPLPGDRRRTAYVEREEPPAEDRSFDA
jgi:hypothetical protein